MLRIFSKYKPYYSGGVEKFNETLCKQFDKELIEYDLIKYENEKFHGQLFYYLKLLSNAFSRKHRNKIIVQYGNFFDIICIFILKLFYKKVYCIAHVGPMWFHLRIKLLNYFSVQILNNFCELIYVISKEQELIFNKHKRIKRINSMIDNKFFDYTKNNKSISTRYFLFYGRIAEDKGVKNLINGFYDNFNNFDYQLIIAGEFSDNSFKDSVYSLIDKYKLKNKIIFKGYIENVESIIELIDNCEAVIYPTYYDAFPLVIIEAFSRGKPCLCSNISESKNFVKNNNLLFDPHNYDEFKIKWKNIINNKIDSSSLISKSSIFKPHYFVQTLLKDKVLD